MQKKASLATKPLDLIILGSIFAISVVLRYIANFHTEMVPGVDGMYYPLQVRCLLERGTLGFSDMPLIFYIEAFVAKILLLVGFFPYEKSIIVSCKLVNVIFPSLIVFPVFFLVKTISIERIKPIYLIVILALSVLNPSILVLFAVDFHKNAVGMLFIFMSVYCLLRFLKSKNRRMALYSLISVLLTLFTHFGCFSALFIFLLMLALVTLTYNAKMIYKWIRFSTRNIVIVFSVFIIVLSFLFVIKFQDLQRFQHLTLYLFSPVKLLSNSAFILMLKGQNFLEGPRLLFFIILNLFSVLSIIAFLKIKKNLDIEGKIFMLSAVLWYVAISNPFINSDIFERMLFISLIPLNIVLIFAFRFLSKRISLTVSIFLIFLLTLTVATMGTRSTILSNSEYEELKSIKNSITTTPQTMVLAQHGTEWWVAWTWRTKTGQLVGLKPSEYSKYARVFYIHQNSSRFKEEAPNSSKLQVKGKYFELYELY